MFDLLGQMLPAAGAVAGGMLQGQQQADEHLRLMQMMALAQSEEHRREKQFPLEMEQKALYNRNLALSNRDKERTVSPVSPDYERGLEDVFAQQDFAGMVPQEAENIADMLARREGYAAAGYRARLGQQGRGEDRKIKLYNLYRQSLTDMNALDAAIASDPEIAGAYRELNNDRYQLQLWLQQELSAYGVKVEQPTKTGGHFSNIVQSKHGAVKPYGQ